MKWGPRWRSGAESAFQETRPSTWLLAEEPGMASPSMGMAPCWVHAGNGFHRRPRPQSFAGTMESHSRQSLTSSNTLSASNIRRPSRISEPARFTMNHLQPKHPTGFRSQFPVQTYACVWQILLVENRLQRPDSEYPSKLDIRPSVAD